MLARLISANQVVLLCDSPKLYLFYNGQVYTRSTEPSGFENLPERQRMRYWPVWTLIDIDNKKEGPPLSNSSDVWPIQTSSPKIARWKLWSKQYGAAVLGMPPWNEEELVRGYASSPPAINPGTFNGGSLLTVLRLCCSLCFRPGYSEFRSRLGEFLPLPDGSTLPTTDDSAIDAVLEVLQMERGRKEAEHEDRDEMGDGTRTPARDQDVEMDGTGQPQALAGGVDSAPKLPVDSALETLVRNATEEFGFAPRDVYNGVFDLPTTKRKHAAAVVTLNYEQLKNILQNLPTGDGLVPDFPHRVVVVSPCPVPGRDDGWKMNLKSIRIANDVVESMRLKEDEPLREMYCCFHGLSEGGVVAGWIYEAFIHRTFAHGWQGSSESMPQPVRMGSEKGGNSSAFTISSAPNTSLNPPLPLRADARTVTRIHLPHGLSDVTLDSNRYYFPRAKNNPLFDSFIINFDPDQNTATISIFQITTSETHGGSAEGYLLIRKIMAHICKLLKVADPSATAKANLSVTYFLVSPVAAPQWKMPTGWNTGTRDYDHRGDVFCLHIPVSARRTS